MMWTIVAPEAWSGEQDVAMIPEEVVCYQGVFLSVSQEERGGYRVKRILSTDPNDFLSSEIYPGAMLKR